MRIFHLVHVPLSESQILSKGQGIKGDGGWIATLLGYIIEKQYHDISVAYLSKLKKPRKNKGLHIDCYEIPETNTRQIMQVSQDIVNHCKPDLIHIHGTESTFGLLTEHLNSCCNTVISLQGLLGPCSEWHSYFGNRKAADIARMHRLLEFPALRGQLIAYLKLRSAAKRECKIINTNSNFIGRTDWDRAHIARLNPSAKYFYGGELLRDAFWNRRWNLANCQRYRLIFTNAGHPRKGTETLLEAATLLLNDFPELQICIAGSISRRSGYGRYIRRKIMQLGRNAIELGQINADQMAEELVRSHIFISPSFIDNSPNALCEAQLVGMPVVSSYTGGVPSLVSEGLTGLFFPPGDAAMLAMRIRQIFVDDRLACLLGNNAHDTARQRHHPDTVLNDILHAYDQVIHG